MRIQYCLSVLVALFLGLASCKSSKNGSEGDESQAQNISISYLNAAQAAVAITKDDEDGFFDKITIADMSIQMKQSEMPNRGGQSKMMYQEMLKSEMLNWSDADKDFMNEVFAQAKQVLDNINPNLYPDGIQLVKTKTNHYGPDVYYTRERAIIIPDNIFEEKSVDATLPIMLHEIFHILSRYEDDFRDEIYALIGFKTFDKSLVLPKRIQDRLLTNPDGARRDYAIYLENENGEVQPALPLIMSTKDRYQNEMPTFFSYLNFDLYPLIAISKDQVTLGLNSQGESALSMEHNSDFFRKIKDNTQYIIHPDEIMADNFMMAVLAYRDDTFEGFSPEGTTLLKQVLKVLKTYQSNE